MRESITTLADAVEAYEDMESGLDIRTRVKFGVPWIDAATRGGVLMGSVVVVGARTGIGKSFMSLLIAASTDVPVLYLSLEDPAPEVGRRVRMVAADRLAAIRFARTSGRLSELKKTIARASDQFAPEIVVVDYLQRVRYDGDISCFSRADQLSEIIGDLKDLAQDNFVLVLNSQVKRPWRPDDAEKPPQLSELLGSSDIENSAELVILVHENEHGLVNPRIAKSKSAPRKGNQLYRRDDASGWLIECSEEELFEES